jgi:acyl-[acyl-carrier-protein]-phospholipid O-acyltransferase/long-chain-fatty-acid--[acyl-carrier-protein] ligase
MSASEITAIESGEGPAESPVPRAPSTDAPAYLNDLPPLGRDSSFWGMAVTQFLGAFNDNLFKQLMLLLATPTAVQLAAGDADDRQSEAMIVFSAAFLIFSGFAGYVSDRVSKRPVIIWSKVAEIAAMTLGMIGFLFYGTIGFEGMLIVLFLMGTQSAFFGPSKYGYLPESLRPADLPRANGIFLMLTFLSIIFGTAVAGGLLMLVGSQRVWLASLVCVVLAVVGTLTSLLIRPVPPANPKLKADWQAWLVPPDILRLLLRDRALLWAILVVAVFWMVGGMVQQGVNALGKTQLGLTDGKTSLLTASIGVGIALGCMIGGYLSRDRVNRNVVIVGEIGIFVTMILMSLRGGAHQHLLGFYGSIPMLIAMGAFTGMFIVPIQVALQSRPPREQKGRMIATMNQCSWIGIILGAILYAVCIAIFDKYDWPRNTMFAVTAALMLPVAVFYRPKDEQLAH